MGTKKLKKENEHLSMSIIDMLSMFDKSKTKKYTQFLVKMVNEKFKSYLSDFHKINNVGFSTVEETIPSTTVNNIVTRNVVCDGIFGWEKMDLFINFCELMERGIVLEKDISKYDSWSMIEEQYFFAKNKLNEKKLKKEIKVIYEDDEFFIMKPLSRAASCLYGFQTKWCTAMLTEEEYFYRHSTGSLIYLINKKKNEKFAFYKQMEIGFHYPDDVDKRVYSVWNQKDKNIDSIQTGIPFNILEIVSKTMEEDFKTRNGNYKSFSEGELNQFKKYVEINEVENNEATTYRVEETTNQPVRLPRLRVRRRTPRETFPLLDDMPDIFSLDSNVEDLLP